MSIIQIMVTIIIVTILVTVILGVASYAAYWLRRGRRPAQPVEPDATPRYFFRYMPPPEEAGDQEETAAAERPDAEVADGVPPPSDERPGARAEMVEAITGAGKKTNGRSGR